MKEFKLKTFVESKDKVYVFGTGKRGKNIRQAIKYFVKEIDGWIVSDDWKTVNEMDGIPVYSCSEVPYTDKDGVVIGFSDEFYNEVIPNIIQNSITNIYFVSVEEYNIATMVARLYFYNIDMNGEWLEFGDFKSPNLFSNSVDWGYLRTFSTEVRDLILPYLGENDDYLDEGPYEYEKCVLKDKDIVIDCGANFGLFSAKAASIGCEVYAFEPQPSVLTYLESVKDLYRDNITIEQYALADVEGETEFYVCPDNIGASGMVLETEGKKITVPVTTIDAYVERNHVERVDFIKADIEGAERLMLQGAKETIRKYAPKLAICTYHLHDDIVVLSDIIREINPEYKICYAWKKLYAWVE